MAIKKTMSNGFYVGDKCVSIKIDTCILTNVSQLSYWHYTMLFLSRKIEVLYQPSGKIRIFLLPTCFTVAFNCLALSFLTGAGCAAEV